MCTVIIGFEPHAEVPLMLAAVRDEMTARPWEWPDWHWPDQPSVLGGRDTREGGTWFAADTSEFSPRVGAVLNGRPPNDALPRASAPLQETTRFSRGGLPLRVTAHKTFDPSSGELGHYPPFHLLGADTEKVVLYGWDGHQLTEQTLPTGVSVVVNAGLDTHDPRVRRYAPAFAATQPRLTADDLRRAREPTGIWDAWPRLLDVAMHGGARTGGADDSDDPASLRAAVDLHDGNVWATSSVTLAACAVGVVRYAFSASPGDPSAWRMVW